MRVCLDANVHISARLVPEGIPGRIWRLAANGQICIVYSRFILDEIYRNLRRKLRYSEEDARYVLETIEFTGEIIKPTALVEIVCSHPSDNRILECALDGRADCIVTGDKRHLLPLKEFRGIPILSPAEFLKKHFS